MYYVTTDSDGERILEDAEISACHTHTEAKDYLLDSFAEVDEGFEIKIIPGYFVNCWKKTHGEPRPSNTDVDPFLFTDVAVQSPGQHSGGFGYWITPIPQVLVAKLVNIKTPS